MFSRRIQSSEFSEDVLAKALKRGLQLQVDINNKGGSPSTGSEDGGPNESLNVENEFDPFLENIPDDTQDAEEPDSSNNTFLTAPPENQWAQYQISLFLPLIHPLTFHRYFPIIQMVSWKTGQIHSRREIMGCQ